MKIEIGNLGDETRAVHIQRKNETTLELRAGVRGSQGYTILTRAQALALSDALRAASRELSD